MTICVRKNKLFALRGKQLLLLPIYIFELQVSILEEEEEPSTNIENNENDKEKDLHVRL